MTSLTWASRPKLNRTASLGAAAILAVATMMCISTPAAVAGDEKLPTGEQVLDNYIKATGGLEAYRKVHNRVTKGTFEHMGRGADADTIYSKANVTIYAAPPNKIAYLMESDRFGRSQEGCDGKYAWSKSIIGPVLKLADERKQAFRNATFQPPVSWRELYETVECVGVEEVNGKPAYKVICTAPKQGGVESAFYDKETGLLLKKEVRGDDGFETVTVVTKFEDYKEVDGILYPRLQTVTQQQGEIQLRYTSIQHNVELPEDAFAIPPDIRELIDLHEGRKEKPRAQDKSKDE